MSSSRTIKCVPLFVRHEGKPSVSADAQLRSHSARASRFPNARKPHLAAICLLTSCQINRWCDGCCDRMIDLRPCCRTPCSFPLRARPKHCSPFDNSTERVAERLGATI
jgi:hypothetical protein